MKKIILPVLFILLLPSSLAQPQMASFGSGGAGGGNVDLSSPSPIGNAAANTGNFTNLRASNLTAVNSANLANVSFSGAAVNLPANSTGVTAAANNGSNVLITANYVDAGLATKQADVGLTGKSDSISSNSSTTAATSNAAKAAYDLASAANNATNAANSRLPAAGVNGEILKSNGSNWVSSNSLDFLSLTNVPINNAAITNSTITGGTLNSANILNASFGGNAPNMPANTTGVTPAANNGSNVLVSANYVDAAINTRQASGNYVNQGGALNSAQLSAANFVDYVIETISQGGNCVNSNYVVNAKLAGMFNVGVDNCNIGVINMSAGQSFTLRVVHLANTSFVTNSSYKWGNAAAPTWSNAVNLVDKMACESYVANTPECGGVANVH